ncbi:glutathione S-transferase family protein [Ramlibacter rhizophilus]|uniref:glutathione transferase n=1 Tax=Ramlibacter rhizophilus TaxID=1781167 RepID=A0A4Z0C2P0_9BURK|nr:glutathione S-transferase [Ramlibacter rhizophilus]TFZ04778.1 glutathione S-transferase [Ramlibacter rhizophilus]
MLTVHHLNLSRSQRVLWLLEELGLPYEVVAYEREARTLLAPEALRRVHPLGKSPVLTDGPLTLAESGAILEYLVEREGGRLSPPPGTPERLRWRYWMHYAEGSLMPPLLMKLLFEGIARAPVPFFVRPITGRIASQGLRSFVMPQLRRHLDFIEAELKPRAWFAGDDFTAADIQMSYPLEAAQARVGLQDYPAIAGYLARIRERPAYQRAEARGGRFGVPGFGD